MTRDDKTVITLESNHKEKPVKRDAALVVIYGQVVGKKYNLVKNKISIGRSSKCDIMVDQQSVSRTHACIVYDGHQQLWIQDMGSTNGSYVNDQIVSTHRLNHGDLLKIGQTIFKFLSGDNIETSYYDEIFKLTTTDGLTQIFNKRYFTEQLKREVGRSLRHKRELSLVIFDIDHFKLINDNYGHLAGDFVLKQLAHAVSKNIRGSEDILARYGGEEFCVLLPETNIQNAVKLAEKLRILIEKAEFIFENTKISLTVSLGVATFDPSYKNSEAFIKAADTKLYEAKRSGRNRVCW